MACAPCGLSSHFNPLPSCEGRPSKYFFIYSAAYFNPLPSCEGRRRPARRCLPCVHISIHSPHARGDASRSRGRTPSRYFNPLPSCEGRLISVTCEQVDGDFNPLPSCEGRRTANLENKCDRKISIHSPHARGDRAIRAASTISRNFNPLPSCEGRRSARGLLPPYYTFQSTPLMRGETRNPRQRRKNACISIHSPHARGDFARHTLIPCRKISIHSPHARGDVQRTGEVQGIKISIHSPHARGDLMEMPAAPLIGNFNPLPSCEGRHHGGIL